jgi:hypothetical protein
MNSPTDGTAATGEVLPQGDLRLLQTELAQRLLRSTIPARLAFNWTDGTPRVIPTWFHWTGEEIVMGTYIARNGSPQPAHRLTALQANPQVAITIDTETLPPEVLLIRGLATVTEVAGVVPEYAMAARRYLGDEAGAGMISSIEPTQTRMARIAVAPSWVGLLDFQTRLPGTLGGVRG